jgi:DHA1 family tetracycline resistance protein-like MFS transporter
MAKSQPTFSIAPLLAVNFVGTLGFSIVTPFLVVLIIQWGGNSLVYGLVAATYSVFQFFGAPILGRMSDRVGRMRVLQLSQLGTLLSWGVFLTAFAMPDTVLLDVNSRYVGEFALTLPLIVVFFARAADGLTGGNVSVSNAYLSDISSEDDRAKNFGKLAVSGNVGYVVGPALGGILGATMLGSLLPVLAAFAISAVALVLVRYGLVDVKPASITEKLHEPNACEVFGHEHKPAYEIECEKPDGFRAILALPNMRTLMAVNFLVMLGFNVFYVVFPVHAIKGLAWNAAQIGIYFAVVSLIMIIVQGPVLSYLSKRWGDRYLMSIGGVFLALGFAVLYSPATAFIYAAGVIIAFGNGLMWPTFMSVLSKTTDSRLQGAVQGYSQSISAIASILGLVVGGLAYSSLGATLFQMAAFIIAFSAVLAITYRPPKPATEAD